MQEIIVHMQNTFFMHHLYMCRYPKIYVFNKSIHKKNIKKKLKTHVEFIVHLSIIHYLPQQCGYHFAIQQKKNINDLILGYNGIFKKLHEIF